MIGLFFASILAGVITGAPFGAAGALVADAALVHDKARVKATILVAVVGNSLLAFLLSFASSPVRMFLQKNEGLFFVVAGTIIIMLGIFLWRVVALSDLSIGKTASSVSVFFITFLHPGSAAALLLVTALFSMNFMSFKDHRLIFAFGIAIGSFSAFCPVGILFWRVRQKAEKGVRQFRYGLAAMLVLVGAYLVVKGF